MDRSSPRTLLEQLVRHSCRTLEETCAGFEQAGNARGEKASLSPRQLSRWMAGDVSDARPVMQRVSVLYWGYDFHTLVGPPLQDALTFGGVASDGAGSTTVLRKTAGRDLLDQVEVLRQELHDAVSLGALSEAGLDEWELTVQNHGQATRFRPAGSMLTELMADFAELRRLLAHRHAASALRRLTRITAQMSGLMFLTLIRLNEPLAARNWARTARVAADEAADNAVRSWVRAQEAYVHYYAGNYAAAITVARRAQILAGATACVGVPLAAALEARAFAALGRDKEVQPALERAEEALASLDTASLIPSAFGYNQAQLHFHIGNAHTHLGNTERAMAAHDHALALYPPHDFLDRTLVRLDTAACIAKQGDTHQAMLVASSALQGITTEQRQGLVKLRGHEFLESLPHNQRALPTARDFQDLLIDH